MCYTSSKKEYLDDVLTDVYQQILYQEERIQEIKEDLEVKPRTLELYDKVIESFAKLDNAICVLSDYIEQEVEIDAE